MHVPSNLPQATKKLRTREGVVISRGPTEGAAGQPCYCMRKLGLADTCLSHSACGSALPSSKRQTPGLLPFSSIPCWKTRDKEPDTRGQWQDKAMAQSHNTLRSTLVCPFFSLCCSDAGDERERCEDSEAAALLGGGDMGARRQAHQHEHPLLRQVP